tara:strand:+ start:13861 stop:14907 length:1047 start_codon:yes stop_codon:yes gene_type:complete
VVFVNTGWGRATSARPAIEVRFQFLETAPLHLLNKLLQDEAYMWGHRLHWDISNIQRVIYQAARRRVLPGVFATDGDRAAGSVYYTGVGKDAVMGPLTIAPEYRDTDLGAKLTNFVVRRMRGARLCNRIESHTPFIRESGVGSVLNDLGFNAVPRSFLTKSLDKVHLPRILAGIAIEPLIPRRLGEAAQVLHHSLAGSPDAIINAGIDTVPGCQRYLESLTESPACGAFEPSASAIATNGSGEAIGIVATTRVSQTRGLIGQISVLPEHQACGVGRALMHHALHALVSMGGRDVALTVTEGNPARKWYSRLGFREQHSFDSYIWIDKDSGRRSPTRDPEDPSEVLLVH